MVLSFNRCTGAVWELKLENSLDKVLANIPELSVFLRPGCDLRRFSLWRNQPREVSL